WMKTSSLKQGSIRMILGTSHFPFFLSRKSGSGPAGVGVGLVVTHVADWRNRIQLSLPSQREFEPSAVVFFPIQRRSPTLRAYSVQSIRKPHLRPAISAIIHEMEEFGVCNQARCEPKQPQ